MKVVDDKTENVVAHKTKQRIELEQGIHTMKNNFELIIEHINLFSKMRKEKYDSLVEAGFTPEQALHIVTNSKPLD